MVDERELASMPMFQGVPARVVAALARNATEETHVTGKVLFLEGSPPRGWYIIVEGLVRVVRVEGARQHVIHVERAGGTLGEIPLFTGGSHPATGITGEATRIVLLNRAALDSAIREEPEIAFLMARRVALRAERLVARLHERSTLSVQSRLIEYLLARPASSRRTISIALTQQRLAEELGTVREVVSRELRGLVKLGWIESLGGGNYRLVNEAALRRALEAN